MEDMPLLLLLSRLLDKECVVLTYINNPVKDRLIPLRLRRLVDRETSLNLTP